MQSHLKPFKTQFIMLILSSAALTAPVPANRISSFEPPASSSPPKPDTRPVPWARVDQTTPPPHNKCYGKQSNPWAKVCYQYPSKAPGPDQISDDPMHNFSDPNTAPDLGPDSIQLTYGYQWQEDTKLPRDQGIAAVAIFADRTNQKDQNAVAVGLVTGSQYVGFGDGFMEDETNSHGKCDEACGKYLGSVLLEIGGLEDENKCGGVIYVKSNDMVRAFNVFRDEWIFPKIYMSEEGNPPHGYQLQRWNDNNVQVRKVQMIVRAK